MGGEGKGWDWGEGWEGRGRKGRERRVPKSPPLIILDPPPYESIFTRKQHTASKRFHSNSTEKLTNLKKPPKISRLTLSKLSSTARQRADVELQIMAAMKSL